MVKIPPKLISKLDASTVKFQNIAINRLKLFDFSKSAILHYSKSLKKDFKGYSFDKFQGQFKLVGFKKDAKVKSVCYKEIVNVGNSYIKEELSDSIFILNMATFEHWILWSIRELILSNPKEYFPKSRKQIEIAYLKKFTDMQKLWEELADDYLGGLPYQGMKAVLKTFLGRFGLKEANFTKDIIGKLNENSQCRNIIIHNQKKVNATYIQKCGKFAKFTEGEHILITEDILFEQADNILRFMQDFRNNHKIT
jgi:hypothetical protein